MPDGIGDDDTTGMKRGAVERAVRQALSGPLSVRDRVCRHQLLCLPGAGSGVERGCMT